MCVCACRQSGLTHTREGFDQQKSELTVDWTLSSSNTPVSVQFRCAIVASAFDDFVIAINKA